VVERIRKKLLKLYLADCITVLIMLVLALLLRLISPDFNLLFGLYTLQLAFMTCQILLLERASLWFLRWARLKRMLTERGMQRGLSILRGFRVLDWLFFVGYVPLFVYDWFTGNIGRSPSLVLGLGLSLVFWALAIGFYVSAYWLHMPPKRNH
jgi:hypothetical protein